MTALDYMTQCDAEAPIVMCESNPRTAAKHAAACANASKAYRRAVYGFQPPKGDEYGVVLSANVHGSIVAVEIRFFTGATKTYKGMFELPLNVFKIDGVPVASSAAIEGFVGHVVLMTVVDRFNFNGILLSNVGAVDLDCNIVHVEPKRVSHGKAAK